MSSSLKAFLKSTDCKACIYIFQCLAAGIDVILVCYFLSAAEIAYVIEYSDYYYECTQAAIIIISFIVNIVARLLCGIIIAAIMVKNIINWLDADKGIIYFYTIRGVVSFIIIATFAAFSENSCIGVFREKYRSLYVLFVIECVLQIGYVVCMPLYLCRKS